VGLAQNFQPATKTTLKVTHLTLWLRRNSNAPNRT
jgi:hypothetical protein